MKQLQKLISEFPEMKPSASLSLFIEAGTEGISALWYEPGKPENPKGIYSGFFPTDATTKQKIEGIDTLFGQDAFTGQFKSVDISYNVKNAVLIPQNYFKAGIQTPVLDLCFGEAGDEEERSEKVEGREVNLSFRIPLWLHQSIKKRFENARFTHSSKLRAIGGNREGGALIDCHFSPGNLSIMAFSENKILMMQQFSYKGPADVSYYLLRICNEWSLKPEEVKIIAHGMIEKDSLLFREICKYFLRVDLGQSGNETTSDTLRAYPVHYYSHLILLASCVS